MDVITAIRTEQPADHFDIRPVSEEVIQEIVGAGHRAQCFCHSQDWHFLVVRDLDILRALSECSRYAGHMAESAFVVFPIAEKVDPFTKGQIFAYMQLAAWDLGIGSCQATIADPELARRILGIPANMILDTAISFGRLADQKRILQENKIAPLKGFVRWEHW